MNASRAIASLGLAAAITGLAFAGPTFITSTFSLGTDGTWNDANNWSPVGIPNNTATDFYDVIIDGGGTDVVVTLNAFVDVNTLTVDAGDEFRTANPIDFEVEGGQITNDGIIRLASTGGLNQFSVFATETALDGTGELILEGNGRLDASVPNNRLTQASTHTIRGTGAIGANLLAVTNNGVITSDAGGILTFDPPVSANFINNETYRAENGGELVLATGGYDNINGVIEAADGSLVTLNTSAIIDGGELTTTGSGVIECLTATLTDVTNSGDFQIVNAFDPFLNGTLNNTGTISYSGTSTAQFRFSDGSILTGGGTINMSANGHRIEAQVANARLTVDDQLIRGGGKIGLNLLSVTNNALIVADDPAVDLLIDPPNDGDFTNNTTIRATGGGTLDLTTGFFENGNGTIEAQDGSFVEISTNVTVNGGTLATSGSGVIQIQTATLNDITLAGDMEILNLFDPFFNGVLNNTGTISYTGTGTAQARFSDGSMLTGGGTINMLAFGNRIEAQAANDRLTNVDNFIHGAGQIGANLLSVTNESLIVADNKAAALIIDPPNAGDFTNNNTIRATAGATLDLATGLFENANGVIEAEDGSDVVISTNATVNGGELTSSGTGAVRMETCTLNDITNSGTLTVINPNDPFINGTLQNTGLFQFEGTSTCQVRFNDGAMLTGGGTVTMMAFGNRLEASTANNRLTNVDNVIEGGGQIGVNLLSFTNQGVINADLPAQAMIFDPPNAGNHLNLGTINAIGDAGIDISTGLFDNQGTITIAANSRLDRISQSYLQTAGTTTVDGELECPSGVVDIQGGELNGSGLVDGVLAPNGGSVNPGNSAGTLNVEGSYEPTAAGDLIIELGGVGKGQSDLLAIDGDAILAGSLTVTEIDGYTPTIGDTFTILTTTGDVSGEFEVANCDELGYVIIYNDQDVMIQYVASINIADINCDGFVNVSDLLILLANWGSCPTPPAACPGNLNGDTSVDISDLLILLANWS